MNGFGWLAREAIADALRRRIAAAVALAALVSVAMLESCTSCSPSVTMNGELRELSELAGTLDDGSALLALARPISRDSFALSRLAGVLGLSFSAGLVMLGSAAALLATRSGLPVAPSLAAGAACALGCVAVAALAMTASLALPRAATLLLVIGGVWLSAFANALGSFAEIGGWLGALDRLGPPLASAMALALAPWLEGVAISGDPVRIYARLTVWAIAGVLALIYAFRRVELRG
jgi:hypothetical protein